MDHECKAAWNKGKNKRMEKLNGTPISKSCVCLHTITNAYTQTEIHMTKIIDVKQNDLFGVWYFQCLSLLKRPSTAYSKHLHSHNETLNCAFLKVSGHYTMKLGGLTACWRQSLLEREIEMTLCVCVPSEGGISLRGNVPLGSVNHHRTPTLLSSPTSDCEPVRTDHLIQSPQGQRETDWERNSFNISIFKLSITCCALGDKHFFSHFFTKC